MKKNNKKRIVVLILLIIMIIIQIKAFKDSRANKLSTITAKIIDTSGLLSDEIYNLQAINEKESGTVIVLPSVINDKKIEKRGFKVLTYDGNNDIIEIQDNYIFR